MLLKLKKYIKTSDRSGQISQHLAHTRDILLCDRKNFHYCVLCKFAEKFAKKKLVLGENGRF